jgi:hypothetical protein
VGGAVLARLSRRADRHACAACCGSGALAAPQGAPVAQQRRHGPGAAAGSPGRGCAAVAEALVRRRRRGAGLHLPGTAAGFSQRVRPRGRLGRLADRGHGHCPRDAGTVAGSLQQRQLLAAVRQLLGRRRGAGKARVGAAPHSFRIRRLLIFYSFLIHKASWEALRRLLNFDS